MSAVECWIGYLDPETAPSLYFTKPGEFVKAEHWKRLRISKKGDYWSGMLPDGRKYRVPFTADPGGWSLHCSAGPATPWQDWEPDVTATPIPTQGGSVTLEELFAEDGETF